MKSKELSICVGELLGVPRVVLRGSMNSWHDQALGGIMQGFCDQGVSSIVLDLIDLDVDGAGTAEAVVEVFRALPPGLCVHVIARARTRNKLSRACFPKSVRLYSSTDEIARSLSDSEWASGTADDEDEGLAFAA